MGPEVWGEEAYYVCCKCGHDWLGLPGMYRDLEEKIPTHCQKCGSVYVKWANYGDQDWLNPQTDHPRVR